MKRVGGRGVSPFLDLVKPTEISVDTEHSLSLSESAKCEEAGLGLNTPSDFSGYLWENIFSHKFLQLCL